jgi:hypothetical protein
LLDLINQYAQLSEGEADFAMNHFPIKRYEKHELIFQEGNVAHTIYFEEIKWIKDADNRYIELLLLVNDFCESQESTILYIIIAHPRRRSCFYSAFRFGQSLSTNGA